MKSVYSKPPVAMRKHVSRPKDDNGNSKEPVQVFCRLRPMIQPDEVSCIEIISDTSLVITSPETGTNTRAINKAIQTSFSHIFGPNASQKEVFDLVALPLVKNLIDGKNSLLFTYGVTGSGKTYTMSGNSYDAGILPRCFDLIFNSITNCQAKKYVFKPDKLNGFEVQSEADALLDRQNELHSGLMASRNGKMRAQKPDDNGNRDEIVSNLTSDSQVLDIDEDNVYAVFVTYIEIYNNSVIDLLESEDGRTKTLQSRIIREDGNRNMYVHGGTEVEVKSSEETLEVLNWGQRRRHVAYTALNAESSRSHSVFTIRLVQSPLDSEGEYVVQDKRVICVSQLSLVDLAGSERSSRSKNTGQRLREAGNINNSLMTLRSCLEILRENQTQCTNKIIPYRDSKLTHIFKNYFDGDGIVRMIVCVNPSVNDYDETIQVMKFAEVSQEVQIANTAALKLDLGYTPGRRQANKIFKEARNKLEHAGNPGAADLEVDVGLVYSLGCRFPELELGNAHYDEVITTLMRFLELRIQKRNVLRDDLRRKQNEFRNMLVKVERDNVSLRIDNSTLRATNDQQKKKISALESHVCKTEAQIDSLLHRLNSGNDIIRHLQQELKNKDMLLNQRAIEKQKVKEKYNNKIQAETVKMSKELETKLRHQRELLKSQMKDKDDKLKLMKQILVNEDGSVEGSKETLSSEKSKTDTPTGEIPPLPKITISQSSTAPETMRSTAGASIATTQRSVPETIQSTVGASAATNECSVPENVHSAITTPVASVRTSTTVKFEDSNIIRSSRKGQIPVVNLRFRRSRSADRWLDHRSPGLVPVGTIFQPLMRSRKSVSQLTDPKDITVRASRYCLVAQDQDTDGELETKLYKGDILPTSGGGAQVVFNDMEYLKQISPVSRRRRSGCLSPKANICAESNSCAASEETNSKKPRV